MAGLTIVNQNPYEFGETALDFSLPTWYHSLGMVMLHSSIVPDQGQVVEVSGDTTIRETFEDQGFGRMDGQIITANVTPTSDYPNPMRYIAGGYPDRNKLIVPDHLEWGGLLSWCMRLEDLCQTEFWPIAAAPKEVIRNLADAKLAELGRKAG